MKAVLQRVSSASIVIDGKAGEKINQGIVVLLGIGENDGSEEAEFLSDKIFNLRIFADENDKMNYSLIDLKGDILIVSNFTLYSDCKKGRRPFFAGGAKPDKATILFDEFINISKDKTTGKLVTGKFGSDMQVSLVNDGPVTIILDTDEIMKK